ncbi:MAG: efflux RND transporter periplasmic adaptor subunit [Sediminicola sp.]
MKKKYGIYAILLGIGLVLGYIAADRDGGHLHQDGQTAASSERWTCSMHPEIVKAAPSTCPLCGMDLVPVEAGSDGLDVDQFKLSEEAMALANLQTLTVGMAGGPEKNTLVLSGKITPNKSNNTIQSALFDGRMVKLNVSYVGQYVKKGELLGTIYSPELYAAQDKLLTSVSYKTSHQKLYDAARNTLGLWKMTDEQIDEVIRTGKPMMNFPLYADVSGTVTEVVAAEGNYYKQGDVLFRLSDLGSVWAVFDAYENQLPFLQEGQHIQVTSNAFSERTMAARISLIEPIVDNLKRTVSVRVLLQNGEGLLKPGMFVKGSVETSSPDQKITIPKSAVLWTGKRSLVYIKRDANLPVFEMAQVTLGMSIGDDYIILDGLEVGDEVVVNGTFTVDAAAQLQGKKSMISGKSADRDMPAMSDASPTVHLHPVTDIAFGTILQEYTALKDLLFRSDSKMAAAKSRSLAEKLKGIPREGLGEKMGLEITKAVENAKKMGSDGSLREQRDHFKGLSAALVNLSGHFGTDGKEVYVQYCPMADNKKGGTWLSFQKKIENPYFGKEMPNCGKVTETLKK